MASWYDFGSRPYLSVAERRRMAEREIAALRRQGVPIFPVTIEGRTIARTFWGRAWCDNLESYRDFENRLPRGRSYVRNAAVIDLQADDLEVRAQVCGSSIYEVTIVFTRMPAARWRSICRDCAGGIDSLVELLQGRFSDAVMERICRQGAGLFPAPAEIHFDCTCPDWASMCKHVAATLYGVGARLDREPELLFRLRGVDGSEMVAGLGRDLPLADRPVEDDRMLTDDDLSALFGLEMDLPDEAPAGQAPAKRTGMDRDTGKGTGKGEPGRKGAARQPRSKAGTAPPPAQASLARKPGKAGPVKRKAARPKPVTGKAASGPARRKQQGGAGNAGAGTVEYELTPDGYVKWWK